MTKHLTATLVAGLATLGLATAPAGAAPLPLPSDARYDVPAGKVEHRIEVEKVEGRNAVPSHTRTESWIADGRARVVVTNLRTGRLQAETVATRTEIRVYNAKDNVVRIERRKKAGGLPFNTAAFESAVQRIYVEQGYVKVVGEKLVNGRRALVTQSVVGRWKTDEPASVTTAVVDAETFALYERSTSLRDEYTHSETITTEVLDASNPAVKASIAMKKHPRAKVVRR